MAILLIFAILFFVGAIYNLVIGDFANVYAGLGFSAVLTGLYLYLRNEEKKGEEFIVWLLENSDRLRKTPLMYKNTTVSIDSVVSTPYVCISFLLFTAKSPTRYFLKESPNKIQLFIFNSLVTLMLGWWAIPFGPIYTIQVLYKNLRGGEKKKVGELIDEVVNKMVQQHIKDYKNKT